MLQHQLVQEHWNQRPLPQRPVDWLLSRASKVKVSVPIAIEKELELVRESGLHEIKVSI